MALTLLIVWTHGCVGLHSWLRLKSWYARLQPLAFAVALILPALSLAGYLAAAMRVRVLAGEPGGLQAVYTSGAKPWMADFVYSTEFYVITFILLIVAARVAIWFYPAKKARPRG